MAACDYQAHFTQLALEQVFMWYNSIFSSTINFLGITEKKGREGWRVGEEGERGRRDKEEGEKGRKEGGREKKEEKETEDSHSRLANVLVA